MPAAAVAALPSGSPALLVHGGAWAIPQDETAAHVEGLGLALTRGRDLLEGGASALETVVAVVAVLEDHPAFDAGRGAVLDRSGHAQLDAGVMCGATYRWGAVANVRRIANPVRVAHRLLEDDGQARLLVADGAEAFAAEAGFDLVANETLVVDRERVRFVRLQGEADFHTSQAFSGAPAPRSSAAGSSAAGSSAAGDAAPHGTVGCVALDRWSRLAAATSTGGAPFTRPGRVGDSPLVGSGFYASEDAAASATGWGEAISSVLLCGRVVDAVTGGALSHEAAQEHLDRMARRVQGPGERGVSGPATGGLIVLDRSGRGGWAFTTPRMARGGWRLGSDLWTLL